MPCSLSGHSYPAAGPPQPCTNFPAASNSNTAGAARFLSASGTVRGRCRIHAWSRRSMATEDTDPMTQLLGRAGGQLESAWNVGTPPAAFAAGACPSALKPVPMMIETATRVASVARFSIAPSLSGDGTTGVPIEVGFGSRRPSLHGSRRRGQRSREIDHRPACRRNQ